MSIHYPETDIWPPEHIDLNEPHWVTVKVAAHIARVDEKTVRRWARERPVAVWTPGGKCWIDRRRLFSGEPPEAPNMSENVQSEAPTLPGILHGE